MKHRRNIQELRDDIIGRLFDSSEQTLLVVEQALRLGELKELPAEEKYGCVTVERLNEILARQRLNGDNGCLTSEELRKQIEAW